MVTKDDFLIKSLWESNKYEAERSVDEFPNKNWSRRGLEDFLHRLRATCPMERNTVHWQRM